MGGVETIGGIAYQQAHAIHFVIDLVEQHPHHQLRVEGTDDVIDIEVLDARGQLVSAHQVKSKSNQPWTPKPIADVLRRWALLNEPAAQFTFITNGELGPGARALRAALEGDRVSDVADALGIDETIAERLMCAEIQVNPSSTGMLLDSAERRIAGLLDPLDSDRKVIAAQRVAALFTALMQRAALPDPTQRLFSAAELHALVGGAYGQRPEFQWAGALKPRYLTAVRASQRKLVPLTLDCADASTPVSVLALVDFPVSALSGPTGSGKSSAVEILKTTAAESDQAVVACRAETYIPGHLEALVADSLGFSLGTTVPTYAGRHALADPGTTVVIDGVSEIPDPMADELMKELANLLTRPVRAKVVLVGRDAAVLRKALAPATTVETFQVTPLPDAAQDELVTRMRGSSPSPAARSHILRVAAKVLGDGVQNPMLLTIYLEASMEAAREMSRAAVYETFLTRMSERAPTVDARTHIAVLGSVFAELLSEQRRYSDRYQWVALTDSAAAAASAHVDGAEVRAAALRIGLVTELGMTGTVAPFHDSLADYLAGAAVATGRASFPDTLRETHTEWVVFATELGVDVTDRVSRDLPFLALRAAGADDHFPGSHDFADRTAEVLNVLLGTTRFTVTSAEALDGRWKVRLLDPHGAISGTVVVEAGRGPLYTAVRLWRLVLRARIVEVPLSAVAAPTSRDDARTQVIRFTRQRQQELSTMLDSFPPAQRSRILDQLRPLGLRFHIGEAEEYWSTQDYPMSYRRAVETSALDVELEPHPNRTVVNHFLNGGPARAAAADIRKAIETLVDRKGWLS